MKCWIVCAITVLFVVSFLIPATANPVYWQSDYGGDWSDAGNWSSFPYLPGLGDDVTISCPGVSTITCAKGDTWINSLQCAENLVFDYTNLHVLAPSWVTGGLTMADGLLDAGGLFTSSGASTWLSGTITGWGGFENAGYCAMDSSAPKTIYAAVFSNSGSVAHRLGSLTFLNGSVLENLPGALYDLQNGTFVGQKGSGQINNYGTFRRSTGSGGSIAIPFNNIDGTIDLQTGRTLSLTGGGFWSGGTASVGRYSTLYMSGAFTLGGDVMAGGGGSISLNSAQVAVPPGSSATFDLLGSTGQLGLNVRSSTVTVDGTLTNSGLAHLYDATFRGSGSFVNAGTAVTQATSYVDGVDLTNTGTLMLDVGALVLANNAVLGNAEGGLCCVRDGTVSSASPVTGQIINSGVFRKFISTSQNVIGVPFYNTGGTVEVWSGQLVFAWGGIGTGGTISVENGASMAFSGTPYTFGGANHITGAGSVELSCKPITIPAGASLSSDLSGNGLLVIGAMVTADGLITNTGNCVLQRPDITGRGGIVNSGLLAAKGGTFDGSTLSNTGTVSQSESAIFLRNGGMINNQVGGLFEIGNNPTAVDASGGAARFTNSGVLRKTSGGASSLRVYLSNTGGTVDVQGGTLSLPNGGSSTGGTVKLNNTEIGYAGSHTFANTLTVAGPGTMRILGGTARTQPNSLIDIQSLSSSLKLDSGTLGGSGTISDAGDYQQAAGGTLLTSLASPAAFGRLIVGADASLDGNLQVELAAGYQPQVGDEFGILYYGSRTGYFAHLIAPQLGAGLVFDIIYEPTGAKLVVTEVPAGKPLASIAAAKSESAGTAAGVDGCVTAVFADCFYIEDANRVGGIRVQGKPAPSPQPLAPQIGQRVHVEGVLTVVAGNLTLADAYWWTDAGQTVTPLLMPTGSLGGAALGIQPGAKDGMGLNNVGLLVRIAGRVTSSDDTAKLIVVSDGSNAAGLRVLIPSELTAPAVGSQVAVTGISTVAEVDGNLVPVLRATQVDSVQ